MSNEVVLEPTEFKDVRTGSISYGFRMYDNYATTYCNTLESIPNDDLELLKLVVNDHADEDIRIMIDYLNDNQMEMTIGDTTYPYTKIKRVIKPKKIRESVTDVTVIALTHKIQEDEVDTKIRRALWNAGGYKASDVNSTPVKGRKNILRLTYAITTSDMPREAKKQIRAQVKDMKKSGLNIVVLAKKTFI